jgi:tetratricopeptide (TPR) repeat protein
MLQLIRGWAAPETTEASERVAALLEKSGGSEQLGNSLATRAFTTYISGDLCAAGALLDQALEIALRNGNPTTLAYRHMLEILVHHQSGDLIGAENQFTAGLAFFDVPGFKNDPVGGFAAAFGHAALNAWVLGRADVGRERAARMMAAVNEANPHDVVWSGFYAAALDLILTQFERAKAWGLRALDLCQKHRFANEAAFAECVLGVARAKLGDAGGITLIRQGTAALLRVGNRISIPSWRMWLADTQLRAGALDDALEAIEEALDFNPVELPHRPEAFRVRGEIRLKLTQADMAEADFRDSIALAQRINAKAYELRSTTSLARLLHREGRRDEARTMLAEIYGWFTEGFDTADLKEAKALLDELND